MYRTVPRLIGAAVLLVALGTAAGCGADDEAACKAVKEEITNVTKNGMAQTGNVKGLAQVYRDGADKIREEGGKGSGDVKDASNEVATEMENLGKAVENLSASNPQAPDTNGLTNAGKKLQDACNG